MTEFRRTLRLSPKEDVMAITYVDCPKCGQPFAEPLLPSTASYRVARTHATGGREPCRVIVTVHPDGSTESEVVPRPLTLEDALQEDDLLDEPRPTDWWMP